MKKIFISVLIGLMAVIFLVPQTAKAQFGKNMVMYQPINWKIYESEHFLIHYYIPNKNDWPKEKEYIQDMVRWTETAYKQISQEIGYEIDIKKYGKPKIFFFWNRSGANRHPIGPGSAIAYTEPIQMKEIDVSKEFPDSKTQQIVTHETTHLFQFSLWKLAKKSPTRLAISGRRFLTFLFEGWAQHTSKLHRTEPDARLVLRYWVLGGGLRYINIKDWVLPGISSSYEICYAIAPYLYDYIEEKYGRHTFAKFVKKLGKVKPTAKGFQKAVFQVLKTDFAELDRGFRKYLEGQYKLFPIEKKEAFEYGKDILVQRRIIKPKRRVDAVYEPVISPSGDVIAGFILRKDNIRVALISRLDGTIIKELTGGFSLYKYGLFPIINLYGAGRSLSFSPDGESILYFTQTASRYPALVILEVTTGKVKKIKVEFDDPQSPEMSSDGKTVIFSAIKNGQRDIFSLNLETKEIKNLTNDEQFDYGPSFSPDEKTIVYVADIDGYKKLFRLDLATLEKTQLTFGPSNEIRPIYSKDGKQIFFISDQDKDKTKNIYTLNLENNQIKQWTDVINGVRTVIPLKDKKIIFGAVGYRDSRHFFSNNLYEMDLNSAEPVASGNNLLKPVELVKNPQMEVKVDSKKITKYNPWKNLYLANAMFYGGISSFYGIYGIGYAYLTDLTYTKHIQLNITKFGKWYDYTTLGFFDISKRMQWGSILSYENHYFYPWFVDWGYNPYGMPAMDEVLYYLRFKRVKLDVVAQYPLDLCHRFEFSLSGTSIKYQHPDWQAWADSYNAEIETVLNDPAWQLVPKDYKERYLEYLNEQKNLSELRRDFIKKYINDGKFLTFNFAFVRDTALFKRNVGPFSNDMYRIDLSWSTGGYNTRISAEGRKYLRLGSEWVFAVRGYGGIQWGKAINPWIIGDLGELRGYQWMQFMGNRILMINTELRFPLMKNFNLLGIYLGDIRAALFMDVARIDFNDKRFNRLNQDDINPGLTKGSVGLDLTLGTVPLLGIPLHLSLAKRIVKFKFLPKLEEKWQVKFYFGYSF